MFRLLYICSIGFILTSCNAQKSTSDVSQMKTGDSATAAAKIDTALARIPVGEITKIEKSESEWKSMLTDQEYYVIREKGTERAFTGDLLKNKQSGTYICAACQLPLFESDTKFKSGTGWPSFYAPLVDKVIIEDPDYSYGMKRVEVLCARCDGHLGHVFEDGPKPTGLRYCINAVSLDFMPAKVDKP